MCLCVRIGRVEDEGFVQDGNRHTVLLPPLSFDRVVIFIKAKVVKGAAERHRRTCILTTCKVFDSVF